MLDDKENSSSNKWFPTQEMYEQFLDMQFRIAFSYAFMQVSFDILNRLKDKSIREELEE